MSEIKKNKKIKGDAPEIVSEQLKELDNPDMGKEVKEKLFFSKSDRNLYIIIAFVVGLLLLFVAVAAYLNYNKPRALTIDEYHNLNLQGELARDQGYIYNGFSFVNINGMWFTRFKSNNTGQVYNVELRYGPHDVEDIIIKGDYNYILTFNSTFLTFDPLGSNLKFVALGAADLSSNMAKIFHVIPFAACTRNETRACSKRPIVKCRSGVPVIFIKQDPSAGISAEESCLIIQGSGFGIVKAVDRLLLAWYGIMP